MSTNVAVLYETVMNDVITQVREAFLDEAVDPEVLQQLKHVSCFWKFNEFYNLSETPARSVTVFVFISYFLAVSLSGSPIFLVGKRIQYVFVLCASRSYWWVVMMTET